MLLPLQKKIVEYIVRVIFTQYSPKARLSKFKESDKKAPYHGCTHTHIIIQSHNGKETAAAPIVIIESESLTGVIEVETHQD